jgi:hypothetical protein
VDARVWALDLVAPCETLKGMRLSCELPGGVSATVTAGELLRRQAGPHFLHARQGKLDVSLAILGAGKGVAGTGELLRLETSRQVDALSVAWEARSLDNRPLAVEEMQPEPPEVLPRVFALHGNHPNPFNPSTTIVFDLPSPRSVQVDVYGLDGRRVARIHSGRLEAGRRRVTWDGVDDGGRRVAAGPYLYRVQAGDWSATGKMVMVK